MIGNEIDLDLALTQLKALCYYTDNDLLDHQGDRETLERVTAVNILVEELLRQVEVATGRLKADCAHLRATA